METELLPVNQFLAFCLLLAVFCNNADADADGPDYWRVVGVEDGDSLNIRSEPNPRSAKVGAIPPNGRCIANRGCQGGLSFEQYTTLSKSEQAERLRENPRWCQIHYQGLTGWVAGRYLAEGGCP